MLLERRHVEADHLLVAVRLGAAPNRVEDAKRNFRLFGEHLGKTIVGVWEKSHAR